MVTTGLRPMLAVAALAVTLTLSSTPALAATAAVDTFTAGTFLVTLGAEAPEPVSAVEGGDAVGVVQSVPALPGAPDKNIVGAISFEPISFRFSPGLASFAKWIDTGFPPTIARRSGVIALGSSTGASVSQRTFANALIAEVVFPKLDSGAGNAEASIFLVAQPTATTYELLSSGPAVPILPKQRKVLTSSFRLTITGLETSQVVIIEALTAKQTLVPNGGDFTPTGFEISNLKVSLNASSATTWFDWFDDFVVKGKNEDSDERSGKIEYLASDQKTVLATLELQHLGILAIGADRSDGWVTKKGAKSASGRVVAELYVESVKMKPGA